jgi:hypothetical protein
VLHDGGIGNSGIPGRRSSRSGGRGDEPQPHRRPPPIERMPPPSMIADFEAHGVIGEDRMWRLQSDVIRPISSGRRDARGTSGARRQDAGLGTSGARSLMDYNGHVNITTDMRV